MAPRAPCPGESAPCGSPLGRGSDAPGAGGCSPGFPGSARGRQWGSPGRRLGREAAGKSGLRAAGRRGTWEWVCMAEPRETRERPPPSAQPPRLSASFPSPLPFFSQQHHKSALQNETQSSAVLLFSHLVHIPRGWRTGTGVSEIRGGGLSREHTCFRLWLNLTCCGIARGIPAHTYRECACVCAPPRARAPPGPTLSECA